jgi:Fe-S cluster biogenesis protein NfuA
MGPAYQCGPHLCVMQPMQDSPHSTEEYPLEIVLQATPNPNALRLIFSRQLLPAGGYAVARADCPSGYPILDTVFAHPAAERVYIAGPALTVTKAPEASWATLGPSLRHALRALLLAEPESPLPAATLFQEDVSARAEFFRQRILPATQQDGGGLYLVQDSGDVLTLLAVGACLGCPYTHETVVKGILTPLQAQYPDLKAVELTD